MPDHPLKSFLVELLPGFLGAVVGYVIGDALGSSSAYGSATPWAQIFRLTGALLGFLVGLAVVALMHWLSRLSAKKSPPPVTPSVYDETVWPPPPQVR